MKDQWNTIQNLYNLSKIDKRDPKEGHPAHLDNAAHTNSGLINKIPSAKCKIVPQKLITEVPEVKNMIWAVVLLDCHQNQSLCVYDMENIIGSELDTAFLLTSLWFWKKLCRFLGEKKHQSYPALNPMNERTNMLGKVCPFVRQ